MKTVLYTHCVWLLSLIYLVLLIINTESILLEYAKSPRIFPDKDSITIETNNNFTLRCEGTHPVNWSLPDSDQHDFEWTTIEIIESSTPDDDYKSGSILNIYNISYVDTGYYYCYYNEHKDELENKFYSTSIYIFVKDEEHLSVSTESAIFVSGLESSIILIPCKPTFPEVNVTLFKNNEPLAISYNMYDPKYGFKVYLESIEDFFSCTFTYFNRTIEEDVYVHFLSKSNFVNSPSIESDMGEHVLKNENLKLKCTVTVDTTTMFTLHWKIPDEIGLKTGRIVAENITLTQDHDNYQITGKSILNINTITEEDAGLYYCIVRDHSDNQNNASIFIQVHEKGFAFIDLNVDLNISFINFTIGQEPNFVKYKINIDSYPPVQLQWYNNKNEEILSGWIDDTYSQKYVVKNDPRYTTLTIYDISLSDFGNYTLKAINEIIEKNIVVKLEVFAKPIVKIHSLETKFFMIDEFSIIYCNIQANPKPKITWFFRQCDSCTSVPLNDSFIHVESNFFTNYTSHLKYKFKTNGYLTCYVSNSLGFDQDIIPILVTDVENGFGILLEKSHKNVIVGDDLMLSCMALKSNFTDELIWTRNFNLKINRSIFQKSETDFSYVLSIQIKNITQVDNGRYTCEAVQKYIPEESNYDYINDKLYKDIDVTVLNTLSPKIVATNMNGTEFRLFLGQPLILFCEIDGIPKPDVIWLKNSKRIIINESYERISTFIDTQHNRNNLIINFTQTEDEGHYECLAINKIGNISMSSNLSIINKILVDYTLIGILTSIFGITFIILSAILIMKCDKEKKLKKKLKMAGLAHFEKGQLESLNPDLPVDEQADLLPYDKKKYEFPYERLKFGKQLGSGAFGIVLKAEAFGLVHGESKTIVAVKMVKGFTDYSHIKALVSELKIMAHLGQHINVVNLLGACTKNVLKYELLVIVEYCQYGNIRNFLIKNREHFINQLDPESGTFNYDILAENVIVSLSESQISSQFVNNDSLNFDNNNSNMTEMTNISTMANSRNSKNVDDNSMMLITNYRGDYDNCEIGAIYSRNLVYWSFQVANGMDYLSSRKVLHGDLAARNILLTQNNIVKICDFGLAKSVYKNDNYKKKGNAPLPFKWMAIESIRDRVFSVQSDVWSFGILLWEIFSLANIPYPEKEVDEQFYYDLLNGYRMNKPIFATNEIYEVMKECWRAKPVTRPSFFEIIEKLKPIVHWNDLEEYSKVSDLVINNKSDDQYLKMLKTPDYRNLCTESNESYLVPKTFNTNRNMNNFMGITETIPLMLNGQNIDNHNQNNPNGAHQHFVVSNPIYMTTFGKRPVSNAICENVNNDYISFEDAKRINNDNDENAFYVNNQTKDWERIFK